MQSCYNHLKSAANRPPSTCRHRIRVCEKWISKGDNVMIFTPACMAFWVWGIFEHFNIPLGITTLGGIPPFHSGISKGNILILIFGLFLLIELFQTRMKLLHIGWFCCCYADTRKSRSLLHLHLCSLSLCHIALAWPWTDATNAGLRGWYLAVSLSFAVQFLRTVFWRMVSTI